MFVEVTACAVCLWCASERYHLLTLGTDHFIFKWHLQFCRKKCFPRLSIQQCCLIWQSRSGTNVTTALPLWVAELLPAQGRSAGCGTVEPSPLDQEVPLSGGQVKAPAAGRHVPRRSFASAQSYLQWTTMGPASGGLQALTRRRKARIGVGYSGTPWSGQAMNWNCRSSRFSLEPFCWRQKGVV